MKVWGCGRGSKGLTCFLCKGATITNGYGVMRVRWPEEWTNIFTRLLLWHECAWLGHRRLDLEVSHLCNKRLCVNPAHFVLEKHEINQKRIQCKVHGFCCGSHHIHCILLCNLIVNILQKYNIPILNTDVQLSFSVFFGLGLQRPLCFSET